ncbi:MAG TPA: hypothetical protein VGH91_14500 [Gammaproteobacteria bacterium]|jgi:hypothetical protein
MKASQVRDLARRYATGKLSQESYRSQRRTLIDSITGGSVQLSYREEKPAAKRPRFDSKLLGLTVVVLLLVGVGVVLAIKHSNAAHASGVAQAAVAPAAPVTPPAPGPALVRSFVDADDWTDGSLQNFERRWQSLGSDEQAKAKDSLTYPRLMSEVHQQIDSEKAVAGSNSAGDAHLVELQRLAKTLGVGAGS